MLLGYKIFVFVNEMLDGILYGFFFKSVVDIMLWYLRDFIFFDVFVVFERFVLGCLVFFVVKGVFVIFVNLLSIFLFDGFFKFEFRSMVFI